MDTIAETTRAKVLLIPPASPLQNGEWGIRTPDGVAPMLVFKTRAINRSTNSPLKILPY